MPVQLKIALSLLMIGQAIIFALIAGFGIEQRKKTISEEFDLPIDLRLLQWSWGVTIGLVIGWLFSP